MANVMRNRGVGKGDRVTIYLPMIPEAAYAMLACARLGAIHSVVFGGFSPDSLAEPHRGLRNRLSSSPPTRACAAAARCRSRPMSTPRSSGAGGVDHVIVVRRTGSPVEMLPGRDVYYDEAAAQVTTNARREEMDAEDPLFILYTSGSTGTAEGRAAHDAAAISSTPR